MLIRDKLPPRIYLHASYESSRGTQGRHHLPNVFVSVFAQLLSNPSSVFCFIMSDTSCSFHLAKVTYVIGAHMSHNCCIHASEGNALTYLS